MSEEKLFGYIAFFNNKKHELYAKSLYDAHTKAVEHFKPSKSKKHLVHVVLAEDENGNQVTTYLD